MAGARARCAVRGRRQAGPRSTRHPRMSVGWSSGPTGVPHAGQKRAVSATGWWQERQAGTVSPGRRFLDVILPSRLRTARAEPSRGDDGPGDLPSLRSVPGSRPARSASWRSCSRTCCAPGNSSFPTWASRGRRAARACTDARTSIGVLRIKQLVFGDGLTLAGARRKIDEERAEPSDELPFDDEPEPATRKLPVDARRRIVRVRDELRSLLALLSRPHGNGHAESPPAVPKTAARKAVAAPAAASRKTAAKRARR